MNARHQNISSNHGTPVAIVEAARATMGAIDLDPCSSHAFNKYVVRAAVFFTAKQNGFLQPWNGRTFCNPPGGYADVNGVCAPRDPETGTQKRRPGDVSAPKLWWERVVKHHVSGLIQEFCFELFSLEQLAQFQMVEPPYPNVQGVCESGQRYDFWWCILRERPRHLLYLGNGKFEEQASPTHHGAVVYAGKNGKRFEKEFAHLGAVGRLR